MQPLPGDLPNFILKVAQTTARIGAVPQSVPRGDLQSRRAQSVKYCAGDTNVPLRARSRVGE